MAGSKGVIKYKLKKVPAKDSPKGAAKALPKKAAKASPKEPAKGSGLTKEAVAEHTRAHDKLMGKGLKTPEDVLAEMSKMPRNEQEQIWKQPLVCSHHEILTSAG